MSVAKATLYLVGMLAIVFLPGEVWGQSGAPGTKLRRVVPPDTETMVSSASCWRSREGEGQRQCSPTGNPGLELMSPPKHGTVRFVDADLGIPRGSGCINSVYGKAVLYRPNPGFVGKDRFTYNVPPDPMAFEHLGRPPGPWTVFITVREKN